MRAHRRQLFRNQVVSLEHIVKWNAHRCVDTCAQITAQYIIQLNIAEVPYTQLRILKERHRTICILSSRMTSTISLVN